MISVEIFDRYHLFIVLVSLFLYFENVGNKNLKGKGRKRQNNFH